MQGYASVRAAAIHYPPSGYLDDSTRRSALADMPGLRLDKEIALVKSNVRHTTTQRLWQATDRLSLRLQNKVGLAHSQCPHDFLHLAWIACDGLATS